MKNKYLMIFGFVLFVMGLALMTIEIKSFTYSEEFPSNFNVRTMNYSVEAYLDDLIYINKFSGQSLEIVTDNTLMNEVKVVIEYPTTSEIDIKTVRKEDNDRIIYNVKVTNDLKLENGDYSDLLSIVLSTFQNKTKYDYSFIKYGKIYVYANDYQKESIKVVNYGGFVD